VPRSIYWTGSRALEWQGQIPVTEPATGRTRFVTGYLRDVLNVFPDPPPWIPSVSVNSLPTQIVSRQPGGPWVVAYTSYSTGTHTGYKYYLVHSETGDYQLFAQDHRGQISIDWHPQGDRLFFTFPDNSLFITTYQVRLPELQAGVLGVSPGGVWSNDGRYRAFTTRSRTQPVAVWDSFTGAARSYCLPETGARGYSGPFVWSPDSRYLALNAPLPKDEAVAGVGQHTLILDIETGAVVDLTTGVVNIVLWAQEPGTYGEGRVVTPTPTITPTAAP
jgi:WD40 repeat protein